MRVGRDFQNSSTPIVLEVFQRREQSIANVEYVLCLRVNKQKRSRIELTSYQIHFTSRRKVIQENAKTSTVAVRSLESERRNNERTQKRKNSVVHRWLTDPQYQESKWSHGSTLEYCKYLDYLKAVNVDYVATWHERNRYQNMPVLRYKDGKNPGKMSIRDNFKLAARSLAVARHPEGRENLYIPRT